MYLGGIWIKSIAQIILSIIIFAFGFIAYKKLNWKQYELCFISIIAIVLLVFGSINISHAINPNIQKANVYYIYQSSNGVIFGREYHFEDIDGNALDLTMDPVTTRKIFKGKEFNKETLYTIAFEKESEAIVSIQGSD